MKHVQSRSAVPGTRLPSCSSCTLFDAGRVASFRPESRGACQETAVAFHADATRQGQSRHSPKRLSHGPVLTTREGIPCRILCSDALDAAEERARPPKALVYSHMQSVVGILPLFSNSRVRRVK